MRETNHCSAHSILVQGRVKNAHFVPLLYEFRYDITVKLWMSLNRDQFVLGIQRLHLAERRAG